MDPYIRRIRNIDDFTKLYAELKTLNRQIESHPEEQTELNEKKQLVEDRLEELKLMYYSLV